MQLDLVVEVIERGLRTDHTRFGLRDLRLVIGRIDLHQEIAGLDALEIGDGDRQHFAGHAAAELGQLGAHIGIIGGLDRGTADPGIPTRRRHHDEHKRSQHRKQRDGEAAPEAARRRLRLGWCCHWCGRGRADL
ncbi:hypothetical protein ACVW1C_003961 [Bradyrhizobium sp. USDA 4011]